MSFFLYTYPSINQPVTLSIHLSINASIYLSIDTYLPICPSFYIYLSIHPYALLSFYLSIHISTDLLINLQIDPWIYLPTLICHVSIIMFTYLFLCLCIYLYIHICNIYACISKKLAINLQMNATFHLYIYQYKRSFALKSILSLIHSIYSQSIHKYVP